MRQDFCKNMLFPVGEASHLSLRVNETLRRKWGCFALHIALGFGLLLGFSTPLLQAEAFTLTDSAPGSRDFHQRFLASYGVNESIEPRFSEADRRLFEQVAPWLADNPRRALQIVEAALGTDANPAFYFLQGNLHYQLGEYMRAEAALRTAVEKMPSFQRAYRTLGLIYTLQKRSEEARTAWQKVITLGGGDAQSYGLLAYALLNLEHYASALSAYEMARLFAPESRDFKRGLAQCLLMTGQHDQAIAYFDELIEAEPAETDYWLLQANALLARERYLDAIGNLVVVNASPNATGDTHTLLGDLYLHQGMPTEAWQSYTAALEASPRPSAEKALSSLENLLNRNEFDYAARYTDTLQNHYGNALAQEPLATRVQIAHASIALSQNAFQRVIDLLTPIVEAQPLNGLALLRIARAHAEIDHRETAEFYWERATLIPETRHEAWLELARSHVEHTEWDQAVALLEKAQANNPQPHIARYLEQVKKAATTLE